MGENGGKYDRFTWFKCLLNFIFMYHSQSLFLEVEDILGNLYYYQLFVLFLNAKSSKGLLLHTVREIKSISKADMKKIMMEYK